MDFVSELDSARMRRYPLVRQTLPPRRSVDVADAGGTKMLLSATRGRTPRSTINPLMAFFAEMVGASSLLEGEGCVAVSSIPSPRFFKASRALDTRTLA
jgi:hypothetical protein